MIEFELTSEETPFGLTFLGREIFFKVPEGKEKEFEAIYSSVARNYNYLLLRAVEMPLNPTDLEFVEDDPYPYRDLPAQIEEETFIELYLVIRALQPARVVLTGGNVRIEMGQHERKAILLLEHPPTDIHREATQEFLIKYKPKLCEGWGIPPPMDKGGVPW